jgi:hypothetical protein
MNERSAARGSRQSSLPSAFAGIRYGTLRGWMRIVGLILLACGLQAWLFDRQITRMNEAAMSNLVLQQQERSDDRIINETLRALQQYWRTLDAESERDRVLTLRDTVIERFATDRLGAVRELTHVVATFEPLSPVEESALLSLRQRVLELETIYADRTGTVLERYRAPPWYLQPTGSLVNDSPARLTALRYNHALSLMAAGDTAAARSILEELRQVTADDDAQSADVLYAEARLQYDAFTQEPDPAYLREALELTRQSVRRKAEHAVPKLFLEYLLSVEPMSGKVEVEPVEGQGSGEGQGERGVISEDAGDF